MHVSNTHLYSPNSACAWGFLLCLRVGSPLAKTCSLPICFEIQHCSSPGCLSHGVQIEKDALSTAASHEAPVHKRARQDCKQKRIFSTGASREAPVDKRARQDCNQNGYFQQMLRTGFPVAAWVPREPKGCLMYGRMMILFCRGRAIRRNRNDTCHPLMTGELCRQ